MKEAYFTPETMDEAVAALTAGLPDRPRGPAFDMSRAALLILDMQRYFLDPGSHACVPSAPAIVPAIERLAKGFLEAGRPIIATRHVNTPEDAGMMGEWWGDLILPGTPMAELDPRIEALATEIILKPRYDAFHGSALPRVLRELGVRQLAIAGVMTHLCVETTARAAFVRDFAVFVPADATATYNREFHRGTLMNLSHGFASVALLETDRP
ncbi:MAG: isochorismatase family protein [Candidatus Krumholzibacteria bacterium]|nr:isochorismatase family protein [Candidatus Krumholzibacteria bacterium]